MASQLEGLEGIEIHSFDGIANLQNIVQFESDLLQDQQSDQQYLVFSGVTETILAEIGNDCSNFGKHRMNHYTDTSLLIIKLVASIAHEQSQYVLIPLTPEKSYVI
jgi:hypothetical protein